MEHFRRRSAGEKPEFPAVDNCARLRHSGLLHFGSTLTRLPPTLRVGPSLYRPRVDRILNRNNPSVPAWRAVPEISSPDSRSPSKAPCLAGDISGRLAASPYVLHYGRENSQIPGRRAVPQTFGREKARIPGLSSKIRHGFLDESRIAGAAGARHHIPTLTATSTPIVVTLRKSRQSNDRKGRF